MPELIKRVLLKNQMLGDILEADALYCTLGYEPRSTHAASLHAGRKNVRGVAVGFTHSKVLAYEASRNAYKDLGFEVYDDISEQEYSAFIVDEIRKLRPSSRVSVDISSMPRDRIATWVNTCLTIGQSRDTRFTFLYSPAVFVSPSRALIQNDCIGPVSPAFSGSLLDPAQTPELIVGLGYEVGKALGATEYIQSGSPWLFIPVGGDSRFEVEVRRVNDLLISDAEAARVIPYRVDDPAGTYADLFSLLRGLSARSNPILLPLGPKIFALIAMLAGRRFDNTSVWRASQGKNEEPVAREASGQVIAVSVEFQ